MDIVDYTFALKAQELMGSGEYKKAAEVCAAGIEKFPEYPLGHYLLSKIMYYEGGLAQSAESLKKAAELYPDSKVKNLLVQESESLEVKEKTAPAEETGISATSTESAETGPDIDEAPETIAADYTISSEKLRATNPGILPGAGMIAWESSLPEILSLGNLRNYPAPPPLEKFGGENIGSFGDNLQGEATGISGDDNLKGGGDDYLIRLARKIENARIPKADDSDDLEALPEAPGEPSVVTETIADIYARQGAYEEAIKAYEKLRETNPGRLEELNKKIEAAKEKLEG